LEAEEATCLPGISGLYPQSEEKQYQKKSLWINISYVHA
jgi:hypothetical protein